MKDLIEKNGAVVSSFVDSKGSWLDADHLCVGTLIFRHEKQYGSMAMMDKFYILGLCDSKETTRFNVDYVMRINWEEEHDK